MTENLPAIPDPATTPLPDVRSQLRAALAWIQQCEEISLGHEALQRILAVERYLAKKHQAAEAQTAARWLEVRIGELLGPTTQGQRNDLTYSHDCKLERQDRVEFRLLAAHRDLVAELVPTSRRNILKANQDQLAAAARADRARTNNIPPTDIRAGDFRTTLTDLTNIDAIITDPPYPYEYIDLYQDLAETAARILKPGGTCAVMVGQSYLPEIFAKMLPHLTYRWTLAYLTPGGQAVQIWERNINTFWKPVILFTNGEPEQSDWIGDVTRSAVNDNDKYHHQWGQSESGMADLIQRLTKPDELICDPFLGGGTTAVICQQLNRRFIGCDTNEDCVNKTAQRLGIP